MNTSDLQIAVTVPVAEALVDAIASGSTPEQLEEILADVAFPNTLAIMLAAAIDPLLLTDADFGRVQYDHPALCYHAGRYVNGDRDLLAVRCHVAYSGIPQKVLDASVTPRSGIRPTRRTS